MYIRYIKIMFAFLAGFMALFYVLQNFANIDPAFQSILYVLSGADHQVYPNSFFMKFNQPFIVWSALMVIFALEMIAAILMLKGGWDMVKAKNSNADDFNSSKKWAVIGSGVGVFVWFGLFGVIGSALFQMWQTQAGAGAMNGAFQYFISCAITLIFISQKD